MFRALARADRLVGRAGRRDVTPSPPRNGQARGLRIRLLPRATRVNRELQEPAQTQRSAIEPLPSRVGQPDDPRPHVSAARRSAQAARQASPHDPPLRVPGLPQAPDLPPQESELPERAPDPPPRASELPRLAPDPAAPGRKRRAEPGDRTRRCAAAGPRCDPRLMWSQKRADGGPRPESGRRRCASCARRPHCARAAAP